MESYKNEFSNNDITVTYEPCLCIHAQTCAKGLSDVFRTSIIPWIHLEGSETEQIISQINNCPSGALKFYKNENRQAS